MSTDTHAALAAPAEPPLRPLPFAFAKRHGVLLREPGAVPLAQRQAVTALVAGENAGRAGLYREIPRANGNPGWEPDIRATFAQRWIDRAPAGWWVQNATGIWQQKR